METPELLSHLSSECCDLVRQMLRYDAEKRLLLHGVLYHDCMGNAEWGLKVTVVISVMLMH